MEQLPYPFSVRDKEIMKELLRDLLPELIIDTVWDDFFYRYLIFESLDGWNKIETTAGNVALVGLTVTDGGYYVKLSTNAATNDLAELYKMHFTSSATNTLDFGKPSRFRCEFQLSSVTAQDAFIYHGKDVALGESNGEVYGFQVANATLKGYAASMITGSLVGQLSGTLATLSANTDYLVEARHFPGEKVVFYVNGAEKGVVTNKSAVPAQVHNGLADFYIDTNANAVKTLFINYFDIIQAK